MIQPIITPSKEEISPSSVFPLALSLQIIQKLAKTMPAKSKRKSGVTLRGFSRGLEAEKIVGATDHPGELYFLVKVGNSPASVSLFLFPNHPDPSGRNVTRLI